MTTFLFFVNFSRRGRGGFVVKLVAAKVICQCIFLHLIVLFFEIKERYYSLSP